MSSTFGSLSIAYSSLVAQRQALDVTGQNVANANTAGYTRQRVDLQPIGGSSVPARISVTDGTGGGVAVSGVQRVNDAFLTTRQQVEHGKSAAQEQISTNLTSVEDVLSEPSDSGIYQRLQDLASGFNSLASSPTTSAPREAVLEQATQLADQFNIAGQDLDNRWEALHTSAQTTVSQVNSYASQIGKLNEAIRQQVQGGNDANELQDQRDGLVLKLSDLVGATGRAGSDGTVDVLLNGSSLVAGDHVSTLALAGTSDPRKALTDPTRVVFSGGSPTPVSVTSGTLGGALDGLTRTYPQYAQKLDTFASTVAGTVNSILTAGRDRNGQPGQPMFGTNDGSSAINARTIAVVITDPAGIAASGGTGADADGSRATDVRRALQASGGPIETYNGIVSGLGVESQSAAARSQTQSDAAAAADDAVTSTSGVDTDEEMTNMLAYQRAYEAAARVMSVMDSTLDTLINNMGVG